MKINAIVMASGLSKRMGENKMFLDFKGKELYQHSLDLLKELDFADVIVVSSYKEILEKAEQMGYKAVYNDDNEVGKSSSIRLGVNECLDEAMMFFVADQPLLSLETCKKLINTYEKNQVITYPVVNDRRGAPVIFPNSYKEELLKLEGDQGGMILAYNQEVNKVEIADESELLDIDTVKTYEDLRNKYE
ncbi:nucleotidyltransferase family protein [uncultured Anaerococcus sp.]|uniref:nucleotidyltransferase family protein n=1 Tax=uncultured Anaerococcus sp. TaxID=293428 RepID=UPI00261B8678|nr:nucleotidyltransferase family protein [uncultured Anaerococcus sp.]